MAPPPVARPWRKKTQRARSARPALAPSQVLSTLRENGLSVMSTGGETADLGDLVRTVVVDSTVVARMRRSEVISNDRIAAGDVIVGIASDGQARPRSGCSTHSSRRSAGGFLGARRGGGGTAPERVCFPGASRLRRRMRGNTTGGWARTASPARATTSSARTSRPSACPLPRTRRTRPALTPALRPGARAPPDQTPVSVSVPVSARYPESFDPALDTKLVYSGKYRLTDVEPETGVTVGKLVLSPTRTCAPDQLARPQAARSPLRASPRRVACLASRGGAAGGAGRGMGRFFLSPPKDAVHSLTLRPRPARPRASPQLRARREGPALKAPAGARPRDGPLQRRGADQGAVNARARTRRAPHATAHASPGAEGAFSPSRPQVGHFLPSEGLHVVKDSLFPVPPLFRLIQSCSGTAWSEMYKARPPPPRSEARRVRLNQPSPG